MKTMSKHRIVLSAISLLCAFSVAGCSAGVGKNTAKSGSSSAAQGDEAGAWSKYSQPVTLTRAQMTFTGSQWQNGDTAENNPWTRAAKSQFNINLKDAWATDGSQYSTKIDLSIASGSLPDVFWVNCNQFQQVVKSGLVADLSGAYKTTASAETQALMNADEDTFNSGKVNSKLMGLSTQYFGVISQLNCVWIRQDWMQKLNLQAPKTMDDLINICTKFTNNDPDGDGKNDTYGLAVDKTLGSLTSLMCAYHAYTDTWLKDSSGSVVYSSIQPEVKTALQAYQNMYRSGIISKDFAVMDSAKATEDLVSGKVGVAIAGSSFGYAPGIDIIKKNGANAIFTPYAIPSSDGKTVKQAVGWPISNYIVVSKKCKNPEAALKMVNLYVKMANQSSSSDYSAYIQNERDWGAIPFQVQNPMADYNQFVAISKAQDSRDTSSLKPDQLGKYNMVIDWIDNKNPDSVGPYLQVSKTGAYSIMKSEVDNQDYVRTEFHGVSTPTMVQKGSTLGSMITQDYTKIIMGQSVSSFDDMVKQWKSLGGDQITKEMNASKQ